MMTKKTATALENLHSNHYGKEYRLTTYDIIRKKEGYPTIETVRKYNAVAEGSVEWYYSEGEQDGINGYNKYVTVIIK